MSHITTVKTRVRFLDTQLLREALSELQALHSKTMTIKETYEKIYIHDPRMQKFREHSLFFERVNNEWIMNNDDYSCVDLMSTVVGQINEQYQVAAIKRVLGKRGYSVVSKEISPENKLKTLWRSYR
jgi:hypothetical protein